MRRGQVEVWGSLDLHGMTQDRARAAVSSFLTRAAAEGARVVIVITGKGRRAAPKPGVLKAALPDWLCDASVRPLVSGYASAHRRHGGDGAYYVFLRARREE